MYYLIGFIIFMLIVYGSLWFYAPFKDNSHTVTCPRCTGEAKCTITGSVDQFESTKCDCGYHKEEVI